MAKKLRDVLTTSQTVNDAITTLKKANPKYPDLKWD
jgi:hypothetical protein